MESKEQYIKRIMAMKRELNSSLCDLSVPKWKLRVLEYELEQLIDEMELFYGN